MPKATKQTKKFVSSGKLKQEIDKRRKHQAIKRKTAGREATKLRKERKGKGKHADEDSDGEDDQDDLDDDSEQEGKKSKGKGKADIVPTALTGDGGDDAEESDGDDSENFSDLDEEDDEDVEEDEAAIAADEEAMAKSLAELSKKDPEFFKYLKENDADLLDFNAEVEDEDEQDDEQPAKKSKKSKADKKTKGKVSKPESDDDEMMDYDAGSDDEAEPTFGQEEEEVAAEKIPVTMTMLRSWQRAMIEHNSYRSLRKTILAFRAAAHMNQDDEDEIETKFKIESAQVFNKLILTALKFTPVVLGKLMPTKETSSGKFKTSPAPAAHPTLPRFALSHFTTIMYLIKSLPSAPSTDDAEETTESLLYTVVTESAKMLPWVMEGKRQVKAYLKLLLDLWSSAADNVRIACFLAVRKVYVAGDESIKELCLKSIYSALLPPLRLTSAHTLPSLNLMKNSAAELYQINPNISYQHAFGYIRALAIHLRQVVRSGQADQEAFRAVYNWQFVHCIDFWSLVLSGACDKDKVIENGGLASPLEPLIFPLTQIALGVVRLVPTSRFFPLRFHVLHSMLRVITRTGTYIPLAPFLLEILDSAEFKKSNPKASSLKALDLEYVIRAPNTYLKSRVYQESLAEELTFLMGEFFAAMSRNISFPEMTIPVLANLKRFLKRGHGSGKAKAQIKTVVEKIEATRIWVEKKRRGVNFAPNERTEVDAFLEGGSIDETPIGSWIRLQKKVRDQRRQEIEAAQREERGQPEGSDDDEEESDVEMDFEGEDDE